MVKKMIVLISALGLIMTMGGMACAFFPGCATEGDMIMIPMKVKTTFVKETGPGGFSSLFMDGCQQYSAPGGWPWGTWKATSCTTKVQVIPPKCVAPAFAGPVQWGAPTPVMPGAKLVRAEEKYAIESPGCNPCVDGPMKYEIVKKQVVK